MDEYVHDGPSLSPSYRLNDQLARTIVIAVNQAFWTRNAEASFDVKNGLQIYWTSLCDKLMETVNLVRGKLSKLQRKILGALGVMDVHNRDTIKELHDLNVSAKHEFDWRAKLRYYCTDGGPNAPLSRDNDLRTA